MPTHKQMVAAVEAYVDAFARADINSLAGLFAPAATVEDPVGAPLHQGIEAVRAFYSQALAVGAKLTLAAPVRTAANMAAFAFSVAVAMNGKRTIIDVIDTFEFDAQGKIVRMRAFWGPDNVHTV